MKLSSNIKHFLVISFFLLIVPSITHAALDNPLGNVTTIEGLIGRLVTVLLKICGSLALLMFVYGGFQYLTSGGDPGKVKKGKETLEHAALGIFIILFSYAAINALIKALTTGNVG